MSSSRTRYPIWSKGDLDGFFGLMVDNLVQVLLIIVLCSAYAGISVDFITTRILPAVAISLLVGNLFYGIQAHIVARRHQNHECTALPFGINTPSVFAFILFIMAPVYQEAIQHGKVAEVASRMAWQAGLLACMVSGMIEFGAAFFAERLRRVTPRAALLGVLAAVGLAFIASDFAFRIYTAPLIGLVPLGILLLAYFAHYRFPAGLPGGFVAVILGALAAWGLSFTPLRDSLGGSAARSFGALKESLNHVRWIPPVFCGSDILEVLNSDLLWRFLTVSVPMGIINAIGSLQNIESAEAAGDRFATGPSMAVNGIATLAAGLFGSCFPTTIYIGHPAWKMLGARSGYSILNGLFFTVCFLFGLGTFLSELIPIEAGAAIVMYIGVIIAAQAFQATPRDHAPAVAIAIFPAMAAILMVYLPLFLNGAGASKTIAQMVGETGMVPVLPGLLALFGANSGWLITGLILTALTVALIEHRYKAAAVWGGVATILTFIGFLHSYRIEGNVIREFFIWQPTPDTTSGIASHRAFPIAIAYAVMTLILFAVAVAEKRKASAILHMHRYVEPLGAGVISSQANISPTPSPADTPPPSGYNPT